MKILLTGNSGLIGQVVEKQLRTDGHEIVGYDLTEGSDIRNTSNVIKAGIGCESVVHLAALLGNDERENGEEITRTNLLGTWNVLESARINAFRKVIFMSSFDALGIFKGEGFQLTMTILADQQTHTQYLKSLQKKCVILSAKPIIFQPSALDRPVFGMKKPISTL